MSASAEADSDSVGDAPVSAPDEKTRRSSAVPMREEGMGGLAKGIAIIESFNRERPRLTVTEAAAATGATPAAARRCLRTLEDLGYLYYDGKYFRPTPRMMRLPASYSDAAPLPLLAEARLRSLRDEFNESASLAVLDEDNALFIARVHASHIVSVGVSVGARLPAYTAASGRVLLSALPDDELEKYLRRVRLEKRTENSLVTVAAVRKRVERARVEGYSFTDQEIELGVRALAVPVVDRSGNIHAAMTVSAFSSRISLDKMRDRFLPKMWDEASKLGEML